MTTMKAIGFQTAGPITAENSFILCEKPEPEVGPQDLLVEVKAVSVNPVDFKIRSGAMGEPPKDGATNVLGFDAAGVVRKVGAEVKNFKAGDEVFYAGDMTRPGTNAELHAVDSRIVGKKPKSLSFADAAAVPLVSITAWEILFDSLRVTEGGEAGEAILIVGAAGGVGSMLVQLAKKLTKLTVVATASRPETVEWVKKLGADHVINHRESLPEQMKALGVVPRYIACLAETPTHFPKLVEIVKTRGHIAMIEPHPCDILNGNAFIKSISFSWECMFTRPIMKPDDIAKQHELLNRVADMFDSGAAIKITAKNFGKLSVETLKAAHAEQEAGRCIGKNVLDGI